MSADTQPVPQPVPQAVFAGDEALQKVAAIADPRERAHAAANLLREYKALTIATRHVLKLAVRDALAADPELRLWMLATETGMHQTSLTKGVKIDFAGVASSPNGSGGDDGGEQ